MNTSNIFAILSVCLWSVYNVHATDGGIENLIPSNVVPTDDDMEGNILPNQQDVSEPTRVDANMYTERIIDALKDFQSPSDLRYGEGIEKLKEALTNQKVVENVLENLKRTNKPYWFNEMMDGYDIAPDTPIDEAAAVMVEKHRALFDELPSILPQFKDPQAMEQVQEIMENPEIKRMIELNSKVIEGAVKIKEAIGDNKELTREQLEEIFDKYIKEASVELMGSEEGYTQMRDNHIDLIINNNFSNESFDVIKNLYEQLSARFIDSVVELGEMTSEPTYGGDFGGSDEESGTDYELVSLDEVDDTLETDEPKSTEA